MKIFLAVVAAVAVLLGSFVDGKIGARRLRYGEPCDTPGFFGDAEDCMKFYRCAEHDTGVEGKPLLAKFTFRCPVGTAFDEDLSTCNYPHSLMNVPPNCPTEIPTAGDESEDTDGSSSTTTASPNPSAEPPKPVETVGTNGEAKKVITLTSISSPVHPIFVPHIPVFSPYSNVLYFKK